LDSHFFKNKEGRFS
jgi:hypothetical protein